MNKAEKTFLVARTCTRKSGNPDEQGSYPLESYRELSAYVLLGDPGAGKTSAFKLEAEASGGEYIKARDFAIFEPKQEQQNKTLFIDALDEMRAGGGDGKTPLDHIRSHLERLGCPHFRLSCREADWLGESDRSDLNRVSPKGEVVALHLDPLTSNDVIEILRHKKIPDPEAFVHKADEHKLGELLRNPQTLNLLIEAKGGKEWPQSRTEIYEMACKQLARENSREHRQAKRGKSMSPDVLLDAAGYLSAIHLLSGIAGFALDQDATDTQHFNLSELSTQNLPVLEAFKTNLFQRDNEEQRIPVHRSVAEFLGARYLAKQIETHGLPFGRVLALITGEDGGIVPDLRGLAAWLSVHCVSARPVLSGRDPLGVVLYGDVRFFPVAAKQQVLNALKNEAQQYPWFRSVDWTSSPFGALGTRDMESAFLEILSSPSRDDSDQALLDCVLDAIHFGEPMCGLADALEVIARDATCLTAIRKNAVRALKQVSSNRDSILLTLALDIQSGTIEDRDDEILGALLNFLYPNQISHEQILGYLHPPKDQSLIGNYFIFWTYDLTKQTEDNNLPLLLDHLVMERTTLRKVLKEHQFNKMAGELLVRGLETYGDSIADKRLYDWLGIGADKYENSRLDVGHRERVGRWFAAHPNRYKAVVEYCATVCATQENSFGCMNHHSMRLHGSPGPADIGIWYLGKATAEKQSGLARYYFHQVIFELKRQGGQQDLTLTAIEFLESVISQHPAFQPLLEQYICCPLGDWQQENALHDNKWKSEQQKYKREWINYFRQHIAAIRSGKAQPQIYYYLAQANSGLALEAHGETPDERLDDFLGGDRELVEAAHAGFRQILVRDDLPSVSKIVELELKGQMPFILPACMIGMEELYQTSPTEAMQQSEAALARLVAFHLRFHTGDHPAWFIELLNARPSLVAETLLEYASPILRAGKEQVSGIYFLAYNDAYSAVARIALKPLLEGFPLRARIAQLRNVLDPLLKGALHYLHQEVLVAIIKSKLELGSLNGAQRVYWLAGGLLIEPNIYMDKLLQYLGKSKVKRGYLASFLHDRWERGFPYSVLSENMLSRLIELFVPDCTSERSSGEGWVTPAMHTADLMRSFVNKLSANPSETATRELERLLALPSLAHWHQILRGALHNQRIARRKASFQRLDVEEVSRTLANLQPANAADLAALTFDHLRDIARKIHDGSTNDYKQYWSYDQSNKNLGKPKPENDCRDALLSDLNERLGKLGINAEREGNYADDKRADIKVLFGGSNGFNVPIEIKKDTHDDLWRAIHEQLIPKYVRDPGADGHGIYLVFWFGGKGMKPPEDGKKLRSAAELEERLRQTLLPEEAHRIQVCVIDCALPQPMEYR